MAEKDGPVINTDHIGTDWMIDSGEEHDGWVLPSIFNKNGEEDPGRFDGALNQNVLDFLPTFDPDYRLLEPEAPTAEFDYKGTALLEHAGRMGIDSADIEAIELNQDNVPTLDVVDDDLEVMEGEDMQVLLEDHASSLDGFSDNLEERKFQLAGLLKGIFKVFNDEGSSVSTVGEWFGIFRILSSWPEDSRKQAIEYVYLVVRKYVPREILLQIPLNDFIDLNSDMDDSVIDMFRAISPNSCKDFSIDLAHSIAEDLLKTIGDSQGNDV